MDKKIRSRLAALALAAAVGLASCSTTSGETYGRGVSGAQAAAERSRREAGEREARNRARPSRPDPLPPVGSRPPARPEPREDQSLEFALFLGQALQPPPPALEAGVLLVEGLPRGADLSVDGLRRAGSRVELPPGEHEVLVSRFGFADFRASVRIRADEVERLEVELESAPFAILSVEASPGSFDPGAPGSFGSCEIAVRVAAPGSLSVEIRDASGTLVRDLGEIAADGPLVRLRWDGADGRGRPAEPGVYAIEARWPGAAPCRSAVAVKSGGYERHSSLFSGVSGTLFAPDARVLGFREVETSFGTTFVNADPSGAAGAGRLAAFAGLRLGAGGRPDHPAAGRCEIDFSAWVDAYPGLWDSAPIDSFVATQTVKCLVLSGPVSAAAFGKLSWGGFLASGWWPSPLDYATRFPGLSGGLALEADAGPLRLLVCPELAASPFYPGYGDGRWEPPSLFAWGYLRVGLEARSGDFVLAASAALRSRPFASGLGLDSPIAAGAELSWHSPDSPLVISLIANGEIEGPDDWYASGGLCVGARFR